MMHSLKVKNFPSNFSREDQKNFLTYFGAVSVSHGQDYAIAKFRNKAETTQFLKVFHQKEIMDKRMKVEYFSKSTKCLSEPAQSKNTDNIANNISEYLLKWFAMHSNCNINQPPPPYLNYKYPKLTSDILKTICVALKTIPKFYIQVLHLMNKMNLPPPFDTSSLLEYENNKKFESVACQTNISGKTQKNPDLMSDESELESEEDRKDKEIITIKKGIKRPIKFSSALKSSFIKKKDQKNEKQIQESPFNHKKIKLNIPSQLHFTSNISVETGIQTVQSLQLVNDDQNKILSRAELSKNRLSYEQMSNLPVFKNYHCGERSNKLYIKNLSKSVTKEDLEKIFQNFTKNHKEEIEIKLMQMGRMKGQAFVTFNTPYDDEHHEGSKMVDIALTETNGYILKDKPMVVMYGKTKEENS